MAFALKLSPARFHALRLLSLGEQLSMPGSRRLLLGLGRLSGRQTLRDASLGAIEPPLFALDPPRLLVQRGLFLPDRREARLEETRRLGRFLAERPNLVLPEQIGQQGLELGIAVGAQLPLALRRKHRGEEGVGAAADGGDAAGIGVHLAVGHGAVVQCHRFPGAIVGDHEQEGFGLAPAVEPDHDLRAVTTAVVRPDQVFLVLGQTDVVVIGEAAWTGHAGSRGHREIRVHVVHHGGLAAPVGADDGDQFGAVGKSFEVESQDIASQAIADAAKAFESE